MSDTIFMSVIIEIYFPLLSGSNFCAALVIITVCILYYVILISLGVGMVFRFNQVLCVDDIRWLFFIPH